MKSFAHLAWTIPAAALLALPVACGGGGGGGGDTPNAASADQVGQAVLVATSAIDAATSATETATATIGTASVAPASVSASAMNMGGMFGSGDFTGMMSGMGSLEVGRRAHAGNPFPTAIDSSSSALRMARSA